MRKHLMLTDLPDVATVTGKSPSDWGGEAHVCFWLSQGGAAFNSHSFLTAEPTGTAIIIALGSVVGPLRGKCPLVSKPQTPGPGEHGPACYILFPYICAHQTHTHTTPHTHSGAGYILLFLQRNCDQIFLALIIIKVLKVTFLHCIYHVSIKTKTLSKTAVLLPRFILVSFLRQLVFCSDHRKKVPTDTLGALGSVFASVSSFLCPPFLHALCLAMASALCYCSNLNLHPGRLSVCTPSWGDLNRRYW